jgi:hypothetical protein
MLLRNLTKHVQNQNWLAVFLDFTIVVVGVFIGIQVANWNDERLQKDRENEILAAILDDIKVDKQMLKTSSLMAKVNIDASKYVLQAAGEPIVDHVTLPLMTHLLSESKLLELEATDHIEDNSKDQLWKRVTVKFFPTQNYATFKGLVAAGELTIISSSDLIKELQRYSQLWRGLETANDSTFRPFRDRAVFVGQDFGLSPFSKLPEEQLVKLVQENPKLKGVIKTMLEFSVLHKRQIDTGYQFAESLIEHLERELK